MNRMYMQAAIVIAILCVPVLLDSQFDYSNADVHDSVDYINTEQAIMDDSSVSTPPIDEDSGVAVFDKAWISSAEPTLVEQSIIETLTFGAPTLVFDETDYFKSISPIDIIIESDDRPISLRGMYLGDDDVVHQYAVISDDTVFSENHGSAWAEAVLQTSQMEAADEEPTGTKLLGVSTVTKDLGNRGEFTVTAVISKAINTYDEDHNTYFIHYYQIGDPNTGNEYHLGDICLEAKIIGGELNMARPTNTSGEQQTTVNLGFDGGVSGGAPSIGFGASMSWSYAIGDVVVKNESSYSQNIADIRHDVDENKNVGGGYTAEPGIMFTIEKGEIVTVENDNSINTYKKDWSFVTFNSFVDGRYDHLNVSFVIDDTDFEEIL